jgi:hypothetical protein
MFTAASQSISEIGVFTVDQRHASLLHHVEHEVVVEWHLQERVDFSLVNEVSLLVSLAADKVIRPDIKTDHS